MRIAFPSLSRGLRAVLRNVAYGLGAQGWSALLGLAAMPILVARLGVESYALLGLNLSVMMLAATGDLGVGRAVGKFIAEDAADRARNDRCVAVGLTLSLVFGLAGAALLAAAAPLIVERVFGVGEAGLQAACDALYVTAATLPAVLLRILLTSVIVSRAELGRLSASTALVDTIKMGLAVAAAWAGAPLAWVLAAYGASTYLHVALLGAVVYVGRRALASPALGWDGATARRLLGFGGWGTAATLSQQALLETDRWLVGALTSLETLGYYSIARDLCLRQAYLPHNILRAYFGAFSGAARQAPEAFGRTYRQAQRVLGAAALPLGGTLIWFSSPLLTAWLGDAGAGAAPAALALAPAYAVASCGYAPSTAIFAGAGRPATLARLTSAGAAVHALGATLGVLAWGATAAGWSLLAVQTGLLIAMQAWLARRAPGAPSLRDSGFEWLVMAATAAVVTSAFGAPLAGRVEGLVGTLAAMALAYLAALAATAGATAVLRRRRPARNPRAGGLIDSTAT